MKESRLQAHIANKKSVKINGSKQGIFRVANFLAELDKHDQTRPKHVPSPYQPDESKLVQRILKLIRVPKDGKDGKVPTKDELMSLISPLIPKVRDGKDADEEMIIERLSSKIRVPQDGKDAVLPDLRDLAINTINQIENLEGEERIGAKAIKGLRELVSFLVSELWGGPGLVFHDTTLSGSGVPGDPLKVVATATTNTSYNETPSGSGTAFTLVHTPSPVNSLMLYRGGALQKAGVGGDYSLSGSNITLNITLAGGEILLATYQY